MEFSKAFEECKDTFDVIINCVSAKIDFSGVLGMLGHDGVAVQVRKRRHLSMAGMRCAPRIFYHLSFAFLCRNIHKY